MVELIFVIIIIGILSVAAIPKFGDIKDRAKVATEYSAMTGMDGAITGAMELQREDFDNINVDWHEVTWNNDLVTTYGDVNTAKKVLNKILKKNDDFKIVAYAGTVGADGIYDDVLFIKGKASDAALGTTEADKTGSLNGKPDKNDVWALNLSPNDATVSYSDGTTLHTKVLMSGEIALIDLTTTASYTGTTAAVAGTAGQLSVNTIAGANAAAELAVTEL